MTEFRPGGFQILPTVIKNLLIINLLVYFGQYVLQTHDPAKELDFEALFALHTWQSEYFKPWQFFTYIFLHAGWMHVLGNMFVLWMFGATLENLWGPGRFLVFYIVCGLGGAFCHMVALYIEAEPLVTAFHSWSIADQMQNLAAYNSRLDGPTLGASGAVFGCLAAFGYLFPNDYIYLNFFIPIKVKWFVLGYIGLELYLQFDSSAGGGIAHMAHLGGALVGFLMVYFWKKNDRRGRY
jgi:membrane associated rhomboid family serine protease